MESKLNEQIRLPAVQFAAFMAAAMLLAFYGGIIVCAAIAAVGALCAVFLKVKRHSGFCTALGAFFGALLMGLYLAFTVSPAQTLCGETAEVELVVSEKLSSSASGEVYLGKFRYGNAQITARLYGDSEVEAGDRICAEVSFRETENAFRVQNLSRGVLISGTVGQVISTESGFSLKREIERFRSKCASLLRQTLGENEAALAQAILLGERGALPLPLEEAASVSGVMHFTAVSGTHFAVLFMVLSELFAKDKRLLKAVLALLFILPAVIFFGATASVLRSAAMIAVHNLAALLLRRSDILNSLAVTVILLSVINPAAVLDVGLQMSVLGVFGAAVVGRSFGAALSDKLPKKAKPLGGAVTALCCSAGATAFTAPVAIHCFGGISLLSAVTTVIIAPLFAATMTLGMLLCISGLPLLAVPVGLVLKAMIWVITAAGRLRGMWLAADFAGAEFLAALLAAVLAAAVYNPDGIRKFGTKAAAVITAFSLFMCLFARENRSRICFVSDGRDGAAVICVGSEAAVFVAGGGSGLTEDIAQTLRENGAKSLRFVAANSADYSGALAITELAQTVPTEKIYAPQSVRAVLERGTSAYIEDYSADMITVGDMLIAAAKVGDTSVSADVVLYTGYKRSAPDSSAEIPLFCSSRQNELPSGGVNIYDTEFSIELDEKSPLITLYGKD